MEKEMDWKLGQEKCSPNRLKAAADFVQMEVMDWNWA